MNKLYYPNFNHEITLLGGQSFSWDRVGEDEYIGITQHRLMHIIIKNDYIHWQTYPQNDDIEFINQYFNVNEQYDRIIDAISKDPIIKSSIDKNPGIRILNQPLDYTILTFIISANNNIPSIRRGVRMLSNLFGQKIHIPKLGNFHLFPTTEKLATLSEDQVRNSKIGFRSKYIISTAKKLIEYRKKNAITDTNNKTEDEWRDILITLDGVGNKIADCVLGYSLGFKNITAIDVWVKRILTDLYQLPSNKKYEWYREWTKDHFLGYATYTGQFLFESYRKK